MKLHEFGGRMCTDGYASDELSDVGTVADATDTAAQDVTWEN